MGVSRQIILTFSVMFSIAFRVAELWNLGSYRLLTWSLNAGFRLSLCNTFLENQFICCNIYLSVNNLLILILVCCIIKKNSQAQDLNLGLVCNAIFPSSLPDNRCFFFLTGEGERSFLCKQAFNGLLHGHCNNLIKIFHHDINIHRLFHVFCSKYLILTVIHSIAFNKKSFTKCLKAVTYSFDGLPDSRNLY